MGLARATQYEHTRGTLACITPCRAEGEKQPNKRERADGISGQDDARQGIEEDAYGQSMEVVYYVTLAGGGPAARLKVIADSHGEVESATLQFQDWFEPWTDAPYQDDALVERYAHLIGNYDNGHR